MQLDIRIPIGLMFGILGAILSIYGLITGSDPTLYKRSLGININLWWGLLFVAFAAAMLLLARNASRKRPAEPPPNHEPDRRSQPPH